mmetsp:Transcript_50557/g.94417  ORF Transcript_50557/g.94417 Transcript_50557/m.94417 type:complete len:427 (+) Transcript_50557:86-1366(+)
MPADSNTRNGNDEETGVLPSENASALTHWDGRRSRLWLYCIVFLAISSSLAAVVVKLGAQTLDLQMVPASLSQTSKIAQRNHSRQSTSKRPAEWLASGSKPLAPVVPRAPSMTTAPPKPEAAILFLVLSHVRNYDTKIAGVMRTWGKDVNESKADSLMIVGDRAHSDPKVLAANKCGNDHSDQLVCKAGYALQFAHQAADNFSWIFLLDDDIYVNRQNIHKALESKDASQKIALGIPGCGGQFCDKHGGFCGGGGIVISRLALAEIMQPSPEAFQRDMMTHLAKEPSGQSWADISISCVLRRHGVPLEFLKGLYGWKVDGAPIPRSVLNAGYMKAITQRDPLPITFHYISTMQMLAIHDEFKKLGSSGRSLALQRNEDNDSESYGVQVARFIARTEAQRLSAVPSRLPQSLSEDFLQGYATAQHVS